jgi:hypothetical protein
MPIKYYLLPYKLMLQVNYLPVVLLPPTATITLLFSYYQHQ